MAYFSLINSIETSIKAEDISINFYSKLSRKFGKLHPLSLQFERFAKEKVIFKKYFTDLLLLIKNKEINIVKHTETEIIKNDISKVLAGIEVVGDHSNLNLLLENAAKFQIDLNNLYSEILMNLNFETEELEKIIKKNKEFNAILMQFVDFKSDDYIHF